MMDLDERDFYCEAVAILSGESMLIPELRHLQALHEAMQEHYEVILIRLANELDVMKRRVMEMS